MQFPAVLVASVVLAVGAAAGVATLMKSEPIDTSAGFDTAALEVKITELEREVQGLRQQVTGSAAMERRVIDPVVISDVRIQAAVARWFSANPMPATASKKEKGGKLGAKRTYQQLISGISDSEALTIWAAARENGEIDRLVEMFEENAANHPGSPDAQVQVGVAYLQQLQGMTSGPKSGMVATKADKVFDKALKIDPQHWGARFVKATALSFWPPMFGKQAEAIDNLKTLRAQQEAKSSQPKKYARTYMMLGNLYSQQGKADLAREVWTKGASLFPDNAGLRAKVETK